MFDLATVAGKIEEAEAALQHEAAEAAQVVGQQEKYVLAYCQWLAAVTRVVLEEKKGTLPARGWRVIVVSLLAKVISTVRAAHTLAAAGHGREVSIVVRSALESLITAAFIAKVDSGRRARRWVQYAQVLRAEFLKRHGDLSSVPEHKVARRKILTQGRRLKKHYPNPRFWASGLGKGSLRHLAQDVDMLWYYEMVYWLASQGTHGSAIAVDHHLGVGVDGTPRFKVGLTSEHLRGELAVCCDLLVRTLQLLDQICQIGLEKLFAELVAEHKKAFDGEAPPMEH